MDLLHHGSSSITLLINATIMVDLNSVICLYYNVPVILFLYIFGKCFYQCDME